MKKLNRRKFIKSSAILGAAAGAGLNSQFLHAKDGIPTYKMKTTAVVIGSGFGGSVASLRLGEAGIDTILVERGQNWSYKGPETFPTVASSYIGDPRTTWLDTVDANTGQIPIERYTGLIERVRGDTTISQCGAGLGGGSLVYGGVLLQPQQDVFEQVFPYLDYHAFDSTYYPRVLDLVSGGSIPEDILNNFNYGGHKAFIAAAEAVGMTVTRSHVGFDWNTIRREIEGELAPAASIGEYVYGCNSGAKNTLDKNYIAQAVDTGNVTVMTLHNVNTIEKKGNGRNQYRVVCDVLDIHGEIIKRNIIKCKYVFMAAGSINTSKILLKANALGDLPFSNSQVGKHWGGNGDELMGRMVYDPTTIGPIQGGPPCIAAHDRANPIKPVGFMHSPANINAGQPDYISLQLQAAMSVPTQLGEMTWDSANDRPYANWPKAANLPDEQAHLYSLAKLPYVENGIIPGDYLQSAIWHPLGGAVMGQACDYQGELEGLSDLFVVDGALMPGSTACANPSLTIAANAERIMEELISTGRVTQHC
ncbi:MAG: cholesterol oxidase [Pseudomonadales bacterium]|nr:cholesterol oxidase [Pseudomonadales bacterium]